MHPINRFLPVVLAIVLGAHLAPASAVTLQIGDVDSFGFTVSPALLDAQGNPADTDGDGALEPGEALPDLNGDGAVLVNSDEFDNRSAAEKADANARFTDVSLATSTQADDPGAFADAMFTLAFAVPVLGDADFGVDHFLNFILGDRAEGSGSVNVDGSTSSFVTFAGAGLIDGGITATSVIVPWAEMTDGQLVIDINGTDPYVAIDAILLAPTQTAPTVSAPPVLALLAVSLLGVAVGARRHTAR